MSKYFEGEKFGKLTIIKRERRNNRSGYLCKCECGNETWVLTSNLTRGNTKSCGCLHENRSHFEGRKFGKLTVLKHEEKNGQFGYLCKCECGNETWVLTSSLAKGRTNSCGCGAKKNIIKNNKKYLEENFKENTNLILIERAIKNKKFRSNTSGVTGVSWYKRRQKWVAYITIQKKRISLGYYDDIEDAENARKEAEEEYFKPFLFKYKSQD